MCCLSGEEISVGVCVVEENSEENTVFNEVEMAQLSFGFGMTFLSKIYPIFYHIGNTVFLKVMIGTNFFSILKMFLFICSYLSVLILRNVVRH